MDKLTDEVLHDLIMLCSEASVLRPDSLKTEILSLGRRAFNLARVPDPYKIGQRVIIEDREIGYVTVIDETFLGVTTPSKGGEPIGYAYHNIKPLPGGQL